MLLRRLTAVALGVGLLLPAALPAEAAAPAPRAGLHDLTTGRIVVRYRPGVPALARAAMVRRAGARVAVRMPKLGVEVLATRNPAATAAALGGRREVLWAQPEVLAQRFAGRSARRFAQINSTPERTELNYAAAASANAGMRGTNVKVGVVDDGVWSTADLPSTGPNPRLIDRGNCSSGACSSLGAVNAGAGSHGTAVATIIGAANNTVGIVGGAPEAKVYAYRVFPDEESGASDSAIAAAIVKAADDGMAVTNLSLGTPFDSYLLRTAVAYARTVAPQMVLVAAAGNDGAERANYPAGSPFVLSVGAAEPVGGGWRVADFSTRGDVDLIAPGVNVRAWYTDADAAPSEPSGSCPASVSCVAGTSFAAPEVTAILAGLAGPGIGVTGDRARAAVVASAKAPTSNVAPLAATGAGRVDALLAYNLATGSAAYSAAFVDRGAWIAGTVGRRRVEVIRVDPDAAAPNGPAGLSASEGSVTAVSSSTSGIAHRSLFDYAAPAGGVIPRDATLTFGAVGDTAPGQRTAPLRIVQPTSGPEGQPLVGNLPTTSVSLTYGSRSSYLRTVPLARGQKLTMNFEYPPDSTDSLLLVWLPDTVTGGGNHASDSPVAGDSSGNLTGTLVFTAPISGIYTFGFMLFTPEDDGTYKLSATVSANNLPLRAPTGTNGRSTAPLRPTA